MEHNLLQNAVVYLGAAVLVVPFAKRLGMGTVLGYLVAGILIGPYGFKLISGVEDAYNFAEFGVVLLLFLIGLELDPDRLWALRRPIFGWGGAQVAGVAAVLWAAALALGIDWKVGLIAGLGLSMSSTAIALASLQERNLMPTPAGQAGFAILLFQDMAAIPMIAIVPLLGVAGDAADHAAANPWLAGLKIVAVLAGLVLAGRFLLNPLLRIIAKTDTREIFTAFALLLVIAIALLMQWIGLSMALGAFIAGVLLADSEYRHALETDLEPFKGLLLGLFFIAVGMSVDFAVFLADPLLILGLVAGFQALKIGVLYALSRGLDIARGQHLQFALLLSQGGEFAFVVFGAAATARVFSPRVAAILVVVVALSMVVTPLVLMAYDRLAAGREKERRQPEPDAIEPNEDHVIIAGFGRFGQIVGRFLNSNGVRLTVLDHDPDQIEVLRRFGFKVFYGDATRADLLRAAGADKARALVVAIDNIDDSLKLVELMRQDYPDLPIFARARNITHYYQLLDRGVQVIERETFEAALRLGREVMSAGLGHSAFRTRQAAQRFRRYNLGLIMQLYPYYKDRDTFVSMSRRGREQLQEQIARERAAGDGEEPRDWD